jgi:uncharacterized protein (UPF0335 family)
MSKDFTTTVSISGGAEIPVDLSDHSHPGTVEAMKQIGRTMMGSNVVAADQLRLFIERVERLEEEKRGLAADVKDVYAEAKANGYDTKTMRKIIALRKMEPHARQEAEALLHTYAAALGLPLFDGI